MRGLGYANGNVVYRRLTAFWKINFARRDVIRQRQRRGERKEEGRRKEKKTQDIVFNPFHANFS